MIVYWSGRVQPLDLRLELLVLGVAAIVDQIRSRVSQLPLVHCILRVVLLIGDIFHFLSVLDHHRGGQL